MSGKIVLGSDVLQAVKDLGADGAHVTTLVVKNFLRLNGFNTTQERVSSYMHAWADRGELEKRDLGQYHEFWLADKGPKHWSETKQEWLYLKDMHVLHVFNAMIKHMDKLLKINFRVSDGLSSDEINDLRNLAAELQERLKEKTAQQ